VKVYPPDQVERFRPPAVELAALIRQFDWAKTSLGPLAA
jgi:hypothetical protein